MSRQELPRLKQSAATTVHTVKASLHGAKPPVWRRLELPSVLTLDMVHEVMQIAFTWHGYHLHQFETPCGSFGRPDDDGDWGFEEVGDESAVALAQVAAEEKAKTVRRPRPPRCAPRSRRCLLRPPAVATRAARAATPGRAGVIFSTTKISAAGRRRSHRRDDLRRHQVMPFTPAALGALGDLAEPTR